LGLERVYRPEELAEELKFGGKRPRDVPYVPVLDEIAYGATGVPLSQALTHPAGYRGKLYWRYTASTLPGPRIEGFTLPERQQLERVGENTASLRREVPRRVDAVNAQGADRRRRQLEDGGGYGG